MNDNYLNESIKEVIKKEYNSKKGAKEISALSLAYIGDAIFEVFVRTRILSNSNAPVNVLNKKASNIVNAKAQSDMYFKIENILTDEEKSIFRRGRNAKSNTSPKNANIIDYKHATGLEAVIGYLYLSGNIERALEIFNMGMK